MNKYRMFFAGAPGVEMIVAGVDMASVVNQHQWSGTGPLIRVELIGSTNVLDTTVKENEGG